MKITEPVALGGALQTLIVIATPIMLDAGVNPAKVASIATGAAGAVIAIVAVVRGFVTPTSKVALTLDDVDKLAAGVQNAYPPPPITPVAPPAV